MSDDREEREYERVLRERGQTISDSEKEKYSIPKRRYTNKDGFIVNETPKGIEKKATEEIF